MVATSVYNCYRLSTFSLRTYEIRHQYVSIYTHTYVLYTTPTSQGQAPVYVCVALTFSRQSMEQALGCLPVGLGVVVKDKLIKLHVHAHLV